MMNLFENLQLMKEDNEMALDEFFDKTVLSSIYDQIGCDIDDESYDGSINNFHARFVLYNINSELCIDVEDIIKEKLINYEYIKVDVYSDKSYCNEHITSAWVFDIKAKKQEMIQENIDNEEFIKHECEKYNITDDSYGTTYKEMSLDFTNKAVNDFINKIENDGYKFVEEINDDEFDKTLIYAKEVEQNRCIIAIVIHPSEGYNLVSCGYDEQEGDYKYFI